jgi:methionyl aminopeptidase
MWKGIHLVKPGIKSGLIGYTIEKFAKENLLSSVHDYCGHGIGKTIHQAPEIRHFGKINSGVTLKEGMIFTIEPMLNIGKKDVKTLSDGWTVVTKDKTLSAQWEHTILVTKDGYEVLTLRDEEVDLTSI